ncbi:hypothetical protein DV737_g5743, partial [Chaetothyriales sp. CBS 132003]
MARPLSLTEELEKVEQQITLTLQEIDRNFSHAHRLVTSAILPIVEQYAAHSNDVWDGSRFWKQFFESSANVSLSGYEEDAATDASPNPHSHSSLSTPSAHLLSTSSVADLDISNLSLSPSKSSTPRPPRQQRQRAADQTTTFADYPSPYEALHEEISATTRHKADPLLCRVLDRNYRIQATPLTTRTTRTTQNYASPAKAAHRPALNAAAATPAASRQWAVSAAAFSSSPIAPPQLHHELFSPARKPHTPGASVRRAASPPKTMQFHVPQSRLLKTPAREASRQMVQDILTSAGVGRDDDQDDLELDMDMTDYGDPPFAAEEPAEAEASPTVVRKAVGLEDETF